MFFLVVALTAPGPTDDTPPPPDPSGTTYLWVDSDGNVYVDSDGNALVALQ